MDSKYGALFHFVQPFKSEFFSHLNYLGLISRQLKKGLHGCQSQTSAPHDSLHGRVAQGMGAQIKKCCYRNTSRGYFRKRIRQLLDQIEEIVKDFFQ